MNDNGQHRIGSLLARVDGPGDLDGLDDALLQQLAEEVRTYIIDVIGEIGGHFGANLGTCEIAVALHSMLKNKVREASVVKALRTARERVAHPDEPLWRIGNRAQVSPLHVTASRADAMDGEIRDKRRIMAILASRELQRAYRLVEHAARGRFPCLDALKPDPYRPVFLAR